MDEMNAVRLVGANRPLEQMRVPVPEVGPSDVLVRVRAAGICHSDAHYRAGRSAMGPLPITLGHEVAGVIERVGRDVVRLIPGMRVCLHYLVTCGTCAACQQGREQFCESGAMLGHHVDGGYAEFVVAHERGVVALPEAIPFAHGAIMMCSSATALHALRKGRVRQGERVAVFGAGGLGMSAIQLARLLGAREVFAIDRDPKKLALAERLGACPVDARSGAPSREVRRLTGGEGVDVALEVIGLPETIREALRSVGTMGRAVVAGITERPAEIDTYRDLIGREAELIGSNDHLLSELLELVAFAAAGRLDLSSVVTGTVPLDAVAINDVLDRLERFEAGVRTVIMS